jgi:hypothetical protein
VKTASPVPNALLGLAQDAEATCLLLTAFSKPLVLQASDARSEGRERLTGMRKRLIIAGL